MSTCLDASYAEESYEDHTYQTRPSPHNGQPGPAILTHTIPMACQPVVRIGDADVSGDISPDESKG